MNGGALVVCLVWSDWLLGRAACSRSDLQNRRESERSEKERQAQAIYLQRMTEEAQRKRDAEEMIALLEKEERDLINRLKKTQELQERVSEHAPHSIRSSRCSC